MPRPTQPPTELGGRRDGASAPSRGDAIALGLIATGAASAGIAAVVAIVRSAIVAAGSPLPVSLPLHGDHGPELAGVTSATYDSATLMLADAPASARWLLLLEASLPALATIAVCAAAWWLGVSLMRTRPFRDRMAALIGTAAIAVIAAGLLAPLCGALARAAMVEHLAASDPGALDLFPSFLLQLDLGPIGWGFALALVAGAFQIGQRLQRDTEGLV